MKKFLGRYARKVLLAAALMVIGGTGGAKAQYGCSAVTGVDAQTGDEYDCRYCDWDTLCARNCPDTPYWDMWEC